MKNRLRVPGILAIALVLSACASYYPSTRDSGVYHQVPAQRTVQVAYVDPLVYPYWSLDYFYYSRFYHPYSVVVHRYDPWYYPYPGWYYGYGTGPYYAGHPGRIHLPWYRYRDRYAGYHPWRRGGHFGYHDRRFDGRSRVHEIGARLQELETRRSLAIRSQRPDRQLTPGAAPWLPATGRSAATRRDDRRRPAPIGPGIEAYGRGTSERRAMERQALLERLRAADRDTRLRDRSQRIRERSPAPPPRTPAVRSRPRDPEPAAPVRRRPVDPTPPRSRPQRRTERQSVQPPARPSSPQGRDRRDRRERH